MVENVSQDALVQVEANDNEPHNSSQSIGNRQTDNSNKPTLHKEDQRSSKTYFQWGPLPTSTSFGANNLTWTPELGAFAKLDGGVEHRFGNRGQLQVWNNTGGVEQLIWASDAKVTTCSPQGTNLCTMDFANHDAKSTGSVRVFYNHTWLFATSTNGTSLEALNLAPWLQIFDENQVQVWNTTDGNMLDP
ncbi:MAG: hypothetical protein Q9162_001402 [Coniocarpon cinnabarinum]